MNRKDAKIIAQTISLAQLADMFKNAKAGITDWKQPSKVNKSITKGTAWNVLTQGFIGESTMITSPSLMAKKNMIHEFGDFLPEEIKLVKLKPKKGDIAIVHQEPKFTKFFGE